MKLILIMTKKFFAVATFALAFAVAFSASAYDLGSTTLKRGSAGAAVSQLQTALNACNGAGLSTDGKFGRGTESAAKAFQASKGLTADGKVGAMTKAALNSCSSTSTSTTGSWGTSSAEGYLADINSDSTNRVSTVYESEMDKVVNGVRVTAKLADQKVEKVTVTMVQANTTTASVNLGKYISSVSLWNGSTKIATMAVADADRSISTDTYTFNFTGLNSVVAKDQIGRFYVSLNANGGLDSNDTTYASWTTKITEIRATSPNGVYATSSSSPLPITQSVTFGKFSANGVKAELGLSASNPSSATVTVNTNSNTNNVTLLKFKITAKNSNLTIRKIPVTVATRGSTLSSIVNSVKLMRDGNIVDQVDGSAATAGVYSFANLASTGNSISSDSTAEFSVVVDLKKQSGNYNSGDTLTASFSDLSTTNFSVMDSNGDQLPSGTTYRTGSAIGSAMTLRTQGISSSIGSAVAPVSIVGTTTTTQADFAIPLTLSGLGIDYYVPKAALYVSSTTMPSVSASKGIYFTVTDGAGTPLSDQSTLSSVIDSSATEYGTSTPKSMLASSSGVAATLRVSVSGKSASSTAGFYKVIILGYAGSESTNTAASALTAFPVENQSTYTVTSSGVVR